MKCKAARHPFSLIEVMIVVVLVGVIAGICVFSLRPFYQSYRFRLEVEMLYELLQELQLEAMTLQSDMKVSFTKKNNKWMAQSSSDEPILKFQIVDLSHIEQIDNVSPIILYSNGLIHPTNIIKLSNKNDHRWLDFSGRHLIKFWEIPPQPTVYEKLPDIKEIKSSFVEKEV
ncbi:MAG: prepilin-type N-terminal cleavage/methylation domain-containing protein [Rhabdochlamydiaceae bacterium]